jgi:hypothetical protein
MNEGPYRLVAIMQAGHEIVVKRGHNPVEVREAASRVARNPKAVRRIELRDLEGSLDAIWDASW